MRRAIYLVRRHRLAPASFQGAHRKTAVYARDYEVVFATSDVKLANARKAELATSACLARRDMNFKYTIGRVVL